MSKESLIFVIGVFVLLLPFLGIPETIKTYAFAFLGSLLMIVGFMLRRAAFFRSIEGDPGERHAEEFSESYEVATRDEDRPV